MVFLITLRSHHFHTLLKRQKHPPITPSTTNQNALSNSCKPCLPSSIFRRDLSLAARVESESTESDCSREGAKGTRKPMHVLFKEAVGLSENREQSGSGSGSGNGNGNGDGALMKKLKKLEEEVRLLKGNKKERESLDKKIKNDEGILRGQSENKSLYALFADKGANGEKLEDRRSLKVVEPMVFKELPPDMVLFVTHMYEEGYFKDANFLPRNKFDITCFENNYARDFVKFAAAKFGEDNQEIAKWLSGSDLKKVAVFGCPSLSRKIIFSAKRLRIFFGIQEDMVCCKCVLNQSCKFPNQSVWKGNTKNLNLTDVMKVLTLYALEEVPPALVVPDEIKASVSRLLKEVLNLSKTIA